MNKLTRLFFVFLVVLLVIPAAALAKDTSTNPHLILANKQVWLALISGLVPLLTYVLNRVGPWVSEPIKATVLLVVSAITGCIYTLITTDQFGWNAVTLQMILTAVVSAFGSHHMLWKPSGISLMLGAGTNRQRPVASQVPPAPAA